MNRSIALALALVALPASAQFTINSQTLKSPPDAADHLDCQTGNGVLNSYCRVNIGDMLDRDNHTGDVPLANVSGFASCADLTAKLGITGTPSATTYLAGNCQWATPAGGGGLGTDTVGTDELDDGASTPADGQMVVVGTGATGFGYGGVPGALATLDEVGTGEITNDSVDVVDLVNFPAFSLLLRNSSGSGDPAIVESLNLPTIVLDSSDWIISIDNATGQIGKAVSPVLDGVDFSIGGVEQSASLTDINIVNDTAGVWSEVSDDQAQWDGSALWPVASVARATTNAAGDYGVEFDANGMRFRYPGGLGAIFDSDGYLGLGSTFVNPSSPLDINADLFGMFEFDRTSNANVDTNYRGGVDFVAALDDYWWIGPGTNKTLSVHDDQRVGVNTVTPRSDLDVVGTVTTDVLSLPPITPPTCSAGDSFVYADTADNKWKACENGTVSDVVGAGGGGGSQKTCSDGVIIENPESNEDKRFAWKDHAVTINAVNVVIKGSGTIDWELGYGTDATIAGNIITSQTDTTQENTGDTITSFTNSSVPASNHVVFRTPANAISGTVTEISVVVCSTPS